MANVRVTERAINVLHTGLAVAGLDAGSTGVRVRLAAGVARTQFADEPSSGDQIVEADGVTIFLDASLAGRSTVVIDVSSEHDTLTVTASD